jgi:tRNA(Arg) A34 adenosine deaminase TadA
MCRKEKFASLAYQQALQSQMNFKHGAIITKGSKLIVSGMNQNDRTSTLGQIHSSVHAEIDVASQLINRFIRKKTTNRNKYKNYLKKYIIWVVRAPSYKIDKLTNVYRNSMPCNMCINKLTILGFTKIGYSDNNGNMIVTYLNKIKKGKLSSVQKQFREHYKY